MLTSLPIPHRCMAHVKSVFAHERSYPYAKPVTLPACSPNMNLCQVLIKSSPCRISSNKEYYSSVSNKRKFKSFRVLVLGLVASLRSNLPSPSVWKLKRLNVVSTDLGTYCLRIFIKVVHVSGSSSCAIIIKGSAVRIPHFVRPSLKEKKQAVVFGTLCQRQK